MIAMHKIEVFAAGCSLCDDAVALVRRVAGPSADVKVHDVRQADAAAKAKSYGVARVPAIVIDGRPADCCAGGGPNEASLRAAGLGGAAAPP